jgi:cellulose synthase/poly-beta-1,6-N-acetylglucosamine synthase-like glycosyltransferase
MLTLALFVAALTGCLYAYAGYPLLLFVRSRLRPWPVLQGRPDVSVSVIVAAHNEASIIEEKIRNTLSLDHAPDRLELIVASDGSTDGTDAIVEHVADERVRLLGLPRAGKINALNRAALEAHGDILVFTDANVMLDPDAVRHLVRNFADPDVGGVCGEKRLRGAAGGDATGRGEGLYGRYDRWVKRLESRGGSVYAADGCMYAIRRDSFEPVRHLWQADDIAISARVILRGLRLVYEPAAVCYEEAPADGVAELRRKARVANHTTRAVLNLWRELPRAGFWAVQLVSHKLVRYMVPVWLILLLGCNLPLANGSPLFAAILVAQVMFYALALAGWLFRSSAPGQTRLLSVPYFFTLVNAAALMGLVGVLRGHRHATWAPRGGAALRTT